jgi:hypothetical protein
MIWHLTDTIVDAKGIAWDFLVGSDFTEGIEAQRIFFWDGTREVTGLLEFRGDACLHFRQIKDRMKRLANDPEYRGLFLRPVRFPVKRYW